MPKLPESLVVPIERVVTGHVQALTRITLEDKNDIVRITNYYGMTQQDVMRMCLMQTVRVLMAHIRTEQRLSLQGEPPAQESVDNTGEYAKPDDLMEAVLDVEPNTAPEPTKQETIDNASYGFDPDTAPGVRKHD